MVLKAEIAISEEKMASLMNRNYSSNKTTQDVSFNAQSRRTKGTGALECESLRNSSEMAESKYIKGFDSMAYKTMEQLSEEAFVEVVRPSDAVLGQSGQTDRTIFEIELAFDQRHEVLQHQFILEQGLEPLQDLQQQVQRACGPAAGRRPISAAHNRPAAVRLELTFEETEEDFRGQAL